MDYTDTKTNVKTTISYLCRKFLQEVMEETLSEVVGSRSFDSLVKAVNAEKEKKAGLQQTILKYVLFLFRMYNHVSNVSDENNYLVHTNSIFCFK